MGSPKTVALLACCSVIIFAPHLLGGATSLSMWFIAAAALITLCCALWAALDEERAAFTVPAGAIALTLQVYTILQAIPLPCGVVSWLSPGSAAAARDAAILLKGQAPTLCTISWDPGSTQLQLAWTSGMLAILVSAAILVQLGHRQELMLAIASSCGLMATSALGHRLIGASSIYGWYTPLYSRSRLLAPLMNENHLAAFLAMGVPLMVALAISSTQSSGRSLWSLASVVTAGTTALTLSRGGFGALLVGTISVLILVASRSLRKTSSERVLRARRRRGIVAVASGLAGIALGLYAVGAELFEEFAAGSFEKLDLIGSAFRGSWTVFLTGFGRGAFGTAFTRSAGSLTRAEFVESLPVQWLCDWGWPVGLAAISWLGWWIARGVIQSRSLLQRSALASLLAVILQNMVDFNIDMLGTGVVIAVLFVIATLPSRECVSSPFPGRAVLSRTVTLPGVGLALGLAALGIAWSGWVTMTERPFEDLYRQVQSRPASEALMTQVEAALARHPSDARLALLGAKLKVELDAPSAESWLAFAAKLAPGWAGPLVLQSYRSLRREDVPEAAAYLREAAERDPNATVGLACPVATALSSEGIPVDILVPQDAGAAVVAELLNRCDSLPTKDRLRADEFAAVRAPRAWPPRYRLALASSGNPRRVVELLEPIAYGGPTAGVIYSLLATAYDHLGQSARGDEWLQTGLRVSNERHLLYSTMAARFGASKRIAEMRDALATMRAEAAGNTQMLADAYSRQGAVEEAYGVPQDALAAYEKAYRLEASEDRLASIYRMSTKLRDNVRATRVSTLLCRGGNLGYCKQPASAPAAGAP